MVMASSQCEQGPDLPSDKQQTNQDDELGFGNPVEEKLDYFFFTLAVSSCFPCLSNSNWLFLRIAFSVRLCQDSKPHFIKLAEEHLPQRGRSHRKKPKMLSGLHLGSGQ